MPTPADTSATPRAPLTRERVLQAALALADAGGIEALSMRKLGQELGVEAMSLYNHVANKDDIRAGIVELVLGEVEGPSGDADWKTAIRQTALSSHEVFLRHPWACSLMMRIQRPLPARMQWMDSVLRILREAGFSPDLTHHAYHALDSHITGFTLWQVSLPFETREELVGMAEDFLREFPVADYPYLLEHVEQHLAESGAGERSAFEFGLDLILDGLERARDAG